MTKERISGSQREGVKWYGQRSQKGFLVYQDIETEYADIFDSLREDSTPGKEMSEARSVPDLRVLLIKYGKYRIKQEFAEDQYIRKFYALIPELDKSLNLILEKVTNFGLVTGINYENDDPCSYFKKLKDTGLPDHISLVLDRISDTAESICSLRSYTLDFLTDRASKFMPNTTELVGEETALELLFRAGSLRNLALMPASAIQVLGAEKALFKHIIHGSPPPKHGVLFKVKGMSSLKTKDRGRVARFIAGKAAIALRADYLGTRIDLTAAKEQLQKMLKRKN